MLERLSAERKERNLPKSFFSIDIDIMKQIKNKKVMHRERRKNRIRSHLSGSLQCPRLSVFRSNQFIYAQLIDDVAEKTLVSASSVKEAKGTPVEKAKKVGEEVAKLAVAKKIQRIVFDRGGYLYAGRVKALAEGARSGGLQF